jgi:hypothetical protein
MMVSILSFMAWPNTRSSAEDVAAVLPIVAGSSCRWPSGQNTDISTSRFTPSHCRFAPQTSTKRNLLDCTMMTMSIAVWENRLKRKERRLLRNTLDGSELRCVAVDLYRDCVCVLRLRERSRCRCRWAKRLPSAWREVLTWMTRQCFASKEERDMLISVHVDNWLLIFGGWALRCG